MKCGKCGQEILQLHPEMCPYCRSKNLISDEDAKNEIHEAERLAKTGRYEDAALAYEKLELWSEAKSCRTQARRKHSGSAISEVGKVDSVTLSCPHCSATQQTEAHAKELTCSRCGTMYRVPEEVRDLLGFEK